MLAALGSGWREQDQRVSIDQWFTEVVILGPYRPLSRHTKGKPSIALYWNLVRFLHRTSAKLPSEERFAKIACADSDVHPSPINERGNKVQFLLSYQSLSNQDITVPKRPELLEATGGYWRLSLN